jgi:hypothetical protein
MMPRCALDNVTTIDDDLTGGNFQRGSLLPRSARWPLVLYLGASNTPEFSLRNLF